MEPVKIGVRFRPAAIVLFYENEAGILRRRTMPVRGLTLNCSLRGLVSNLRQRHTKYLENVEDYRLEKMLRLIQENMKGHSLQEALVTVEKEFSIDPDEDLNQLDDESLKRKKEIMNEQFELNKKSPGDPDFKYDIEVDFSQADDGEKLPFDDDEEDD